MKHWLVEYFYHTKMERRGALLLAVLSLLLFLLPRVYPLFTTPSQADYAAYADSVQQYLNMPEQAVSSKKEEAPELFYFDPNTLSQDSLMLLGLSPKVAKTIVKFRTKVRPFQQPEDLSEIYNLGEAVYQRLLPYVRIHSAPEVRKPASAPSFARDRQEQVYASFPFDPNTLSGDSLQLLGLSGRTVRNLIKYREKGGRFRTKEDLQKIYGLRPSTYERLAASVRIGKSDHSEAEISKREAKEPRAVTVAAPVAAEVIIDINRATAEEWQRLKGIGPSYARRICAFRDKLGGFLSVNQVAETYDLPDSTFQAVRPKLKLSPVFRKINVNQADAAVLQAHPYLSWKQANAIVAYRSQHGAFRSVDEVAKVRALPPELHQKMRVYWRVD